MEEGRDLHPLAAEIVSAVVSGAASAASSDGFEGLLARFACGWVTDEERIVVITGLTESEDRRMRLLQMLASLKSGSLPVDDPVLARAAEASVRGLMNVYAHWKEVCARALAGSSSIEEIRSIKSAMRRMGSAWRLNTVALSTTRGKTDGGVSVQPGNARAQLFIRPFTAGGVSVSAELNGMYESPRELALYVVGADGDWIFLGAALTEGPHWELAITGITELLSTPAAELQPSWLALTESPYVPSRNAVRLERSSDGVDSSVWLTLTQAPTVSGEELSIGIELPDLIRADLVEGTIVASIDLGSFRFPIGRWRVINLPASPQVVLKARLEGVADGDIELQSAIRLSFVSADLDE